MKSSYRLCAETSSLAGMNPAIGRYQASSWREQKAHE